MARRRSPRPFDVALAATLHDPPGALALALRWALPRLAATYRAVAVATSPPTSPRLAAILEEAGMYGEWAALLLGLGREVGYLECRGLDWETPDRHPRAVRRAGLAVWRRRHETPAEWSLRTGIAIDFLTGFRRSAERAPRQEPLVI